MSMIGNFLLIADAEIESLLASPESIHEVLERAFAGSASTGSDRHLDIDKAWHCLHYLLTGSVWEGDFPLNFIACGGESIGDEDVGYGPARALRAAEVAALDQKLAPLTTDALLARFDGAKMDELEIYPSVGGWSRIDAGSDEMDYFTANFESLKELVSRGRREGLGLLVWLN